MTRNETLTLLCLMLLVLTDAALVYGVVYVRGQVESVKRTLRAIPGVGNLIK